MKFKNLRLVVKTTAIAALCAGVALGGCSSFDENTGSAAQFICAVDTPCSASQSCVLPDGTNLTCIAGFMAPLPDVCGLGNACTQQDSWCCAGATGADRFTCTEAGTYSLILADDPKCTCATDVDLDGYTLCENDCNDADPLVNPGATEICNLIDDNCNGQIDEGVQTTFCADTDLDTYGDPLVTTDACTPPVGYVVDCTDCNDADPLVNPGATEICNVGGPIDDNCNGMMESSSPCDAAADLFCPNDICSVGLACVDPDETCYDNEAAACSTPADLRCCGGVQTVDVGACALVDADSDGYASDVDCNDADAAINPGATEVCDGVDNNCDTVIDEGNPGGGGACSTGLLGVCSAGITTCTAGALACVQTTASSAESCNGLDDDCDGVVDNGNPGGGAACGTGLLGVCAAGTQTCTSGSISCVQNVASSAETCNGLDDDCDGVVDNGCLHAIRLVWTPPVGYVQSSANVFAVGGTWDPVALIYTSYWRDLVGVPALCTMVLNSTIYECTINLPDGVNLCTNGYHADATCNGTSFGIANGGYMFYQADTPCGNCIGLGDGCAAPTEFGAWDVYEDGVLKVLTTTPNGQTNAYNECFDL